MYWKKNIKKYKEETKRYKDIRNIKGSLMLLLLTMLLSSCSGTTFKTLLDKFNQDAVYKKTSFQLVNVTPETRTLLRLKFNKIVSAKDIENTSTYKVIDNSDKTNLIVLSSSLDSTDKTSVLVSTGVQSAGSEYTITVVNFFSEDGLAIDENSNSFIFTALNEDAVILSSVKIASNNNNSAFAKTGDIVTLSFVANTTLSGSPLVNMANEKLIVENTSNFNYEASFTLNDSHSEGLIAFTIDFSALLGFANIQVSSTTDGSSVTFDKTAPALTINQSTTQLDPVISLPISFTVIFSEEIDASTFTVEDIIQNGTATGISWVLSDLGDHTVFSLQAIAVSGDGTLQASILADTIKDKAGNNNTASSSTDNSISYTIPLNVTINQNLSQADPTNTVASGFEFDVVFDKAINIATFTSADIIQNGTATVDTWTISNTDGGLNKTFSLKATVVSTTGTIIPSIDANVIQTASGQNNQASSSTDNTVTYDLVKPNITINQKSGQADPVNTLPVEFDVVFSIEIDPLSFDASDISESGSASGISWSLTDSGDHKNYTLQATAISTDGDVVPEINANAVKSPAGNDNNTSTTTDNSVTYDTTAPLATYSNEPADNSGSPTLDITIAGAGLATYQYDILAGTTCAGASYSSFINVSTHITDDLTGFADEDLVVCIKGRDAALNEQLVETSYTWTRDTTGAVAAITGEPSGTNNITTLNITVAGTLITNYKYKIGNGILCTGGGYSASIAVGINISDDISSLADGSIKICVLGSKDNSTFQAEADATTTTWTKDTTPPSVSSAETLDTDNNGKIDHYKITFTSPVDDSTFPGYSENALGGVATAWAILNFNNLKLRHGSAVGFATDIVNDEILYLSFDENTDDCTVSNPPLATDQDGCDSGSKPDLTMGSTALKDTIQPAGNTIAIIATGDISEDDGAAPVVLGAYPYSNISLHVYYSETVTIASSECSDTSSCSSIYGLSPSLAITEAVRQSDNHIIKLTMAAQTESTSYTLTSVAGVVKAVNNAGVNSSANTAIFSGAAEATNLISASAIDNTTVELEFNVSVTSASAQGIPSTYSIPGLTISAANMYPTPGSNSNKVRLTTSSHLSSTSAAYTVTISSGVVTAASGAQTCSSPNNTASFTGDTLASVVSVTSASLTEVDVTFSEAVLWDSTANGALLAGNYCIEELASADGNCTGAGDELAISSVASVSAQNKVRLTAAGQTSDVLYQVSVKNVVDITAPVANTISATANTGNFIGGENIKVVRVRRVLDSSSAFNIFKVEFSKPFKYNNGVSPADDNDADNLSNWDFGDLNTGGFVSSLCTASDDAACPISYTQGTDTVIYFKVTPEPGLGAHTVVGATATGSPVGASACILPDGGTSPADCLESNPDDRGTVDFGLPIVIEDGPVYTDPFNDNVTYSGQVIQYNGRLLIGPNDSDSGLFMTDINLSNSVSITLDADDSTSGFQQFNNTGDGILASTTHIDGIDNMYVACVNASSQNSNLTGTDCTTDSGTEYLFITGYTTRADGVYETAWFTSDTVSPFVFHRIGGLSAYTSGGRTLRSMSLRYFKGWMYYASQHNYGSYPPRMTMFNSLENNNGDGTYGTKLATDMSWRYITRIGDEGAIRNGQRYALKGTDTGLVSIDYMYEYDNDGTDTNESQLYLANGGSCQNNIGGGNDCLTDMVRNTTSYSDGGIVRTVLSRSIASGVATEHPGVCANSAACDAMFEDVTPDNVEWNMFMSKPLPQVALTGEDWSYLAPVNSIIPAIKAIPKMVEFNGDLYLIRNACATVKYQHVLKGTVSGTSGSNTLSGAGTAFTNTGEGISSGDTICVNTSTIQCRTVASITDASTLIVDANWTSDISPGTKSSMGNFFTDHDVCPGGQERPQLWRLPKGTTASPKGAGDWIFIGDGASNTTRMLSATWTDGSDQLTKSGNNIHVSLLVKNGARLYIGFDNHVNGLNVWRTKSGITAPADESDFEAVCQTGNSCSDASKQFGWGSISDKKIFDGISVNDAGTDYVIFSTRTGVDPMRIYRTDNN